MSGGSFLWVILDIESLEIYVPVIICIRIDNMKCWNFLKDFPMKFGMFSLISKSQDVKNSWHQTDRISNFIAAKNERTR